MNTDNLTYAHECGFPIRREPVTSIRADLVDRGTQFAHAIPISESAGVIELLTDHVPSPDLYARWERASSQDVTVTVTDPDTYQHAKELLEHLQRDNRPPSAHELLAAVTDDYPHARAITFRPGIEPWVDTGDDYIPCTNAGATVADHFTHLLASVPAHGGTFAHADVTYKTRACVTSDPPSVTFTTTHPGPVTLADLAPPAAIENIATAPRPLTIVTGSPRSGRTTFAAAIAAAIELHHPGDIHVISEHREPVHKPTWSHHHARRPATGADTAAEPAVTNAAVIIVDTDNSETNLALATAYSQRGMRCVAVTCSTSSDIALDAAAAHSSNGELANLINGVIYCQQARNTLGEPVVVYEVITATECVRAAVAAGDTHRMSRCAELDGAHLTSLLEWSLLSAVHAGVITAEEAAARARDPRSWALANGKLD